MNTIDLDLVRKYNVAGPRYTSYPPATQFTNELPLADVVDGIRRSNETAGDLSLYFHLPFCRSLCWYCGCTTVITTQQSQSETYLGYLEKEMDMLSELLHPDRQVVQLHFGGGTPTYLRPSEIRRLGMGIRERFHFGAELEAGVEIDPRRLTLDHVKALREVGCNRASIGVQDHDPKVQQAVHRIQPFSETQRAIDWLRAEGFESLNLDLIYGLPHQTPASFGRTLDEILSLAPERLAVFNYAHVPWLKPAQRILEEAALPSAESKLEILRLTVETLAAAGYVYIGMDHFARADDELAVAQRNGTLQRNFQGYSTRGGCDIFAFGMSSISQTEDLYWQNEKELPKYYARLEQGVLPVAKGLKTTLEARRRRQVIMRLMCDLSLDFQALSAQLKVDFEEHFADELTSLQDMEEDGLLERFPGGMKVTAMGRLLIRNLAMRFDPGLSATQERRFSRTI